MKDFEIVKLLEELTEIEDMLALAKLERDELRDKALTPKVRAEFEAIEAELGPRIDAGQSLISTHREKIKGAVLEHGSSLKGGRFHVIYANGTLSVDTRGLLGYAKAHPEVAEFITKNKPSVRFVWLKEEVKSVE